MKKSLILAFVLLAGCTQSATAPVIKKQYETTYVAGGWCDPQTFFDPSGLWTCDAQKGLTPVGG